MFQRFYRCAGSIGTISGTGIGLSVVRRIIEAHQGSVSVESDPVSGTTFSVRLKKHAEDIHLAPKEFETLRYLMENAGRPVRHETLLRSIWGPSYGNEREYLRVVINQLRKKIEDDPMHPTYILTESHIGYRLREA